MYMDDYKRWLEADLDDPALTEELKKMLDDELDKPAEMINTELIHVLLDILEPASPTQDQIDQGFAELVDMIESDIAWRSFVNSNGNPYVS